MKNIDAENVVGLIDECLSDIASDEFQIDLITLVLKLARKTILELND